MVNILNVVVDYFSYSTSYSQILTPKSWELSLALWAELQKLKVRKFYFFAKLEEKSYWKLRIIHRFKFQRWNTNNVFLIQPPDYNYSICS